MIIRLVDTSLGMIIRLVNTTQSHILQLRIDCIDEICRQIRSERGGPGFDS